jgi:hypothetical protein
MCFPHVVNIATQRILRSLTNTKAMGDDDDANQKGAHTDGEDNNNNEAEKLKEEDNK